MRILLDLQACQASSMHRGMGRYSLALALAIVRNRGSHDVRIVLNGAFPDSAIALRHTFEAHLPAASIGSFITPLPAAEGQPRNRWRLQAAERIREHFLASLQPDVVHVSSLFEGYGDDSVNSLLHGEGRFDTAVTLYDLIPMLRKEHYLEDPNLAAWYYRKLESLKRAELLVAISAHAREEAIGALALAPDSVVNISSAADAIFAPRQMTLDARAGLLARHGLHRPFIMYTGGIDYRKNIEALVEAYAALPGALRHQHQLAIVCAIRPPDRVRLQRLAAKLGLGKDELVLTGFVSDDDLVSLYNCTALFVFPSLHEGFGLPVLEAMACGAPVIGSNTSSIPEVIGRADAMFDPTSVSSITAAMAHALGDPAFASALRTHGLAQAALFSWDASAQRTIAAFEEVHARNEIRRNASACKPRLRLAYVARPGDTEASASLLPALAGYYDVEAVHADDEGGWINAHAYAFDRIVYGFEAASANAFCISSLERHPGVVILDDALPNQVPHCAQSLYLNHGYRALLDAFSLDGTAVGQQYACEVSVLDRATGVIVYPTPTLAQEMYEPALPRGWRVVPRHSSTNDTSALLHEAIETFTRDSELAMRQRMIQSIAAIRHDDMLDSDRVQVAASIAANRPATGERQLLIDVTILAQQDAAPLAQWQRGLVRVLIAATPAHWRVEPVQHDGTRYRYGRRFTLDLLGMTGMTLEDSVADASAGDVLLGIDLDHAIALPAAWEVRGARMNMIAPETVTQDVVHCARQLLRQLGAFPPEH